VIKLTLIAIWIILSAILFLSVNMYALAQSARMLKAPKKPKPIVIADMEIAQMEQIVQDKDSPFKALQSVADALIAHHMIAPKKEGKTSKEAKRLLDIIFTMAGHKNMQSEARGDMLDRLSEANPSYAKDFDRAQARK
jgi:hypothetical protein